MSETKKWIEERSRVWSDALTEFCTKASDTPRCFDGCDQVFMYAARLELYKQVLSSLDNAVGKGESEESRLGFLQGWAERKALDKAQSPSRSTSDTANLFDQYYLAALATLADDLKERGYKQWSSHE